MMEYFLGRFPIEKLGVVIERTFHIMGEQLIPTGGTFIIT
jgi:hypothetical protein